MAAYGIIANVAIIATALFTGLAQGIQPLASQYYAGDREDALKVLLRLALTAALILAAGSILAVLVFTRQIAAVFNEQQNAELAAMAQRGLRLYFLGFLPAGLNIVMISFLSATLRTGQAVLVSVLRSSLILIPAVLILSRFFGLTGTWLSFLVTELLVVVFTLATGRRHARRRSPQDPGI